ncbi:glycosyltransferase family 2 protein [Pedobacter cryotolerans]|uniref:Glycosyltransferase n=1 Tax=Pedobacter cryotolerans TaxID=2571270 RepID=A0A4U1C2L1_9SPHI|nr:glycosyltransferase [Pedobacter cryotolerans]TKB98230.1 glycosyltransferase [Pedobacter cryotolerans]
MAEKKINDLVSVIIPAYNAELTIEKTLVSVFEQTYENIEIIVINDGSTDDTLKILRAFDEKIKIISTPNQGVSNARTLGTENSKGAYIQFLDADDLLDKHKINVQISALKQHDADIAYGDWQKFVIEDGEMRITEMIKRRLSDSVAVNIFSDFWCPPAVLLFSRKIISVIQWNKNLPVIQDARYLLDAALSNGIFTYTPGIMASYRIGQRNSLSTKNNLAFVKDCFVNAQEIYDYWNKESAIKKEEKHAIVRCVRYCINEFRYLDRKLQNKAIDFLLKISPNYIPEEKGSLRILSSILGYKNAEKVAMLKRRLIG